MLANPKRTKDEIVQWIREYFAANGNDCCAVIGISGGKDKLGERRFSQFLDVRMADILAHAEGTQESRIERCIALGSIMSEVLEAEQCFALKDLQINGRDIMNLGIEQGKRVGEILNSLLDEVISGALENEHNALMQRAVELLG